MSGAEAQAGGELLRMEQRAWNWGRWASGYGDSGGGAIASVERMYVAPRPDDAMTVRTTPRPIDMADAEHIERCVVALPSAADRRFMKQRFARGLSGPELAMQMRMASVDMVLGYQARVLGQVLEFAQLKPEALGRIIQQRVARLRLTPCWRLDSRRRVRF